MFTRHRIPSLKFWLYTLSFAVILIGCLALVGWVFNIPNLKSILPGLAPIKVNTTLCFVLIGISLVALHQDFQYIPRRFVRLLALIVFIVGLVTIAEYVFGWNAGIDELIFQDAITSPSDYPGRMSEATAFSLVILSLAIWLLSTDRHPALAQILALIVMAEGLFAFVGYLYGSTLLSGFFLFETIPLHSAVAQLLSGTVILLTRPTQALMADITDSSAGGFTARRLLPMAIIVPLFIGWLRLKGQQIGLYGTELGLALFALSNVIIFVAFIWWNAHSLNRVDTERRKNSEHVRKLNRTLSVLSEVNQAIVRVREMPILFEKICEIAITLGGFRIAWIGLLDSDAKRIELAAHYGASTEYRSVLNNVLSEEGQADFPIVRLVLTGERPVFNDFQNDPRVPLSRRKQAQQLGYRSAALVPLKLGERIYGVIALYAEEPYYFDDEELRLIDEMASDIAFAIEFTEQEYQRQQAQAALQESELRYHRVLDSLLEGAQIIGFDWRYLYINEGAAAHGRSTRESLLGVTMLERYPGIENSPMFATLQKCMNERISEQIENEFIYADGSSAWFELSIQPIPEGLFILTLDITERKKAEEALRQSEQRFRSVVEDQTELICRYDLDLRLTFANRAYAAAYGKRPEAMLGMSILDMIPAENRDAAIEHVRRLNPTHLVATSEHPSILPDNTIRWVQWTDRALLDRQGNVVQYQGVGRDITDQKRLLEEQSRHAREEQAMRRFLQTTLDALSAGLAVLDPDGTIVNVNNAWRRFNTENGGISPGAYVNTNYLSVCDGAVGDSAEEAQPAAAGIRAVINNQEDDFYLEYPCHSPHQQRWFGMRVTPFLEPAPRRVVVVHTDISERKLVEDSERVQRRIAEAMRDTLATLASSLEVETVLHQLLQYAEQVVPYNAACIVQFENDVAFVTHSRGFTAQEDELFRGFRFSISNSFYFKALQQGHPYLVKNSRQDPRWIRYTDGDWSNSGLGIPIIVQNKVFGALTIDSKLPNSYSSTDLENLQVFARYAALALENAHYAQRLEQRVLERTNELNHAKERVEAILNNSTDGILLADANLLIRQSNPSFNALFRTSPDNSFAKSLIDFVDDDDAARLVEVVQAVIQQQQGQYSDIRCVRSDGTRFDARFSIGYVFGEDAQLGIVCTIQDVTERKREQQLLAEERNMLRTLIDTTPDFIYIKDTNHRFLLSNLAHTLARGKKSPDELIGKTDADYFPQEVADQFHAEETEIFRSGIPLIDHEQPSITEVGGFAWASSKPRVFVRWAQARNCLRCGRMAANSQ